MIGLRRAPCPSCGSAACAVQSLKVCRHTGRVRSPGGTTEPAVAALPKPKKSPSNKGRNPEKETT